VARWAGTAAGVYCLLYGVAGAVIGMSAKVLLPDLDAADDAFAHVVEATMPALLAGLVLAAALSAVMSTSSGALIATATGFGQDILGKLRGHVTQNDDHAGDSRWLVAGFGVVMIAIACLLQDVVAALTVAYDILVGGLLVPILGGLLWRRGTGTGALAAMGVGTVATLVTMFVVGDLYANEPVYVGLGTGLVAYVVGSLATRPTDPEVLAEWDARSRATVDA
jgi:SSS family solute:Na+ symporter